MRKSLLIVVFSLFCASIVLAQETIDPNTLTLVDVYPADTIEEANMTISPDGSMLVFGGRDELCIRELPSENETCYPAPEGLRVNSPLLYWSPDSRYIALHEDFFRYFTDSDIWIFDVQEQAFQNLTEDDSEASILSADENPPIDYLPAWHPVTGDLYFFRSYRMDNTEGIRYTLALFRSARENGELTEPVQHRNLTAFQQDVFAIFNSDQNSLDGAAAISPDGTQMAVLYRPAQPEAAGVRLIDMDTGIMRPFIPSLGITQAGLPEFKSAYQYRLEGLAWANGGEGLVVKAVDTLGQAEGILFMAYYVSMDGDVTPLIDFSDVPNRGTFFSETPDEGFPLRYDVPLHSVLSPDGNTFFYASGNLTDYPSGLSALSLPPDGSEPIRLAEFEAEQIAPYIRASVGQGDGVLRVVVFGHVFTFEQ